MIPGACRAAETEVLGVPSPIVPVELSLDLIDGFLLAGMPTGTPSMTLFDDLGHIGSWYKELKVVVLTWRCGSISTVDEVVVDLELMPTTNQFLG